MLQVLHEVAVDRAETLTVNVRLHGVVDEKVCSLSVRIGFMYGALASDVADASAGSGARRAVRLILLPAV